MVDLISPGVQVQVIDESPYVSSGPGTVPLIILATSQDKVNPSGTGIATGTLKSEANKVKLITSQRELIQTFGEPTFYTSQGTPLHGYELNEYGLLAAYSYLGIANRAFVLRGDIDLKQLAASTSSPRNKALNGTYWFDVGSSRFGVFSSNGRSVPGSAWESRSTRVIETDEEIQNNLTGVVPRPTNAVPIIISAPGVLKINDISVNLLLNDNLSDVVASINAASIPNIEAISYRLGEKSYITIVNTIGGSIDLLGSDTSVLIDLGLSTAQSYITPKSTLGNVGDFSVYVLQNDNQIYQKLIAKTFLGRTDDSAQAWWYRVGSDDWKKADPAVSIGTNNPPATGPGDTFYINGEAITLSGTSVLSAVSDINSNVNLAAQFITAREFQGRLYITSELGGSITIADGPGNPAAELGINSIKGKNLYYAPHTRYPSGSVRGDVWIRTTTPNNGANYVVKRYNSSTDTWTVVDTPWFTHGVRNSAVAEAYLNPTSVDAVTVTAGGNGYTSAPAVNFVGGGGLGATATAYLGYSVASVSILGTVSSAAVTAAGSGYTSAPTVTFSGGGGSGASGTAVLSPTGIQSLALGSGGTGYTFQPSINFTGGGGTGAVASAIFAPTTLSSLSLLNGGTGYTTTPSVTITGGGGSGATGSITMTPTSIATLPVVSGGSGYTSTPSVAVTGGGGSGATGTVLLTPTTIDSFVLTAAGSNYTSQPSITVSGGGGSGAVGEVLLTPTDVASFLVTNPGTGFTGTPSVSVIGGGGTGATGTAVLNATTVNTVNITTNGSGYTGTPTGTITGGGGSGATVDILLSPTSVSSFTLTSGGTGYTATPSVSVTSGSGTGAAGSALLNATTLASVSLTSSGTGYTSVPTVTVSGGGGSGATASAVIAGETASVNDGGTGYTVGDTLTVVGGTFGTAMQLQVDTESGGVITGVSIITPGDYTVAPTNPVSVTGGTGSAATFDLTYDISSITVNTAGSGYTATPSIAITSGGGAGATADAVLTATSVSSVSLDAAGSGYTETPVVSITGGGGTGATADAVLTATSVNAASVTAPGSGYTGTPSISITGGGGSGATANVVLDPTTLDTITVGSSGSGYISNASVSITGGGGAGATAEVVYTPTTVDSISVILAGTGYTGTPSATISGGGGSGATADILLVATTVSSITLNTAGSGYTSDPTVTISGGGGAGATASATFVPTSIGTISLVLAGTGYTSIPSILFSGGGGSGANATALLTATTITGFSITNAGSGYTSVPTVSITGGGGSGATATASLVPTGVSSISITSSGSNYVTAPIITLTGGGGSGALASASINFGGSGWSGTPIVTFSGGGGTGASAVATVGYSINSLNLVNGGTGYTSSPSVTFVGGNGTGATGTSVLGKTISNITTVAGTGYTSPPSVVFTGGSPTVPAVGSAVMKAVTSSIASGGTGYNIGEVITCSGGISPVFMQVAATSSGVITAANIISAGSYLSITPTLTQVTSTGSGTGAVFNITWGLGSIQFTPGQGYETVPTVSLSGGGGVGATATAFLSSTGSVKSVTLTNPGTGYTTAPAVVFTGGGGNGAVFAAVLNPTGNIKSITVVTGGSEYNNPPTITITGAGSGALPVANLSATGSVTDVVVTNPGLGYTGNVTVTFTGGSGSGAAADAILQPTTVGGILLQSPGGWYSAVPTISITGGGGTDATAVATINNLGGVATVQLTNGGTNYTSVPAVEFVTSQTSVIRLAEADRNALLTLDPTGDGMVAGVIYVAYNIEALSSNDGLTSQIMRRWNGTTWEDLSYEASITVPTTPPGSGALWYNTNFRVDVMVNDGDQWFGYQNFYPTTDPLGVILNGSEPLTQTDGTPLVQGDLWIDTTDLENYPKMYRFDATFGRWELIDKTDQTTPFGIIFADARWNADGTENGSENIAALLNTNYVDPDAPDPRTFPSGMLMFNTRYSFGNVKEWKPDWFKSGPVEVSFDANTDYRDTEYNIGIQTFEPVEYPGRWVTVSGNKIDGSPYMLRKAQRRMVIRALQAAVNANQDIRSEDRFFNLIATPGYVELIDEMFTLNVDKKEWAFIIGDTPLRLPPDGTSITDWALNRNMSPTNDEDGLTTSYYNLALYYPWGYTSDLRGNDVVVPPSHIALRTYAYNDSIAYPWFAPAGFTRGLVSNATTVGYLTSEDEFRPVFLNQGQRDVLYSQDVRINPIAFIPGRGLVVYGQRTRHPLQTALDRVNVARLICYMRYQLDILMKPFLFEPNDQQTRDVVKLVTDRFLGELLSKRALYDYLTVCDETNNTPARIDRNELWVDIAIQPVKVIEFIYVPIRIVNTGVALS